MHVYSVAHVFSSHRRKRCKSGLGSRSNKGKHVASRIFNADVYGIDFITRASGQ